jgi:predicted transcriptional regulator
LTENVRSTEKYNSVSPDSYNDLRGTIKKETGEIRELKLKLDMISKQCKMYEEIIDKMDERIKKLLQDQHKKTLEIDDLRE